MIDKIGHVKNPLTVIAMFAGLAEVSGAAVLPFLESSVQAIYVWFLSLFPCLIVGLFFFTLWKYPKNLYAPSDYSDENNFVAALGTVLTQKVTAEVLEASAVLSNEGLGGIPLSDPLEPELPLEETTASHPFSVQSESTSPEDLSTGYISRPVRGAHNVELANKIRSAEHYSLRMIESQKGFEFRRNVSPVNLPQITFDAVYEDSKSLTIAEVRYSSNGRVVVNLYRNLLNSVLACYIELYSRKTLNFSFIFVLVVDKELSTADANEIKHRINELAETYPFKTTVIVHSFKELQNSYVVGHGGPA